MILPDDVRDAMPMLDTCLAFGRGVTTPGRPGAIGRLKAALPGVEKARLPSWEELETATLEKIELAEAAVVERSGG
jgi:hypothetical protein